MAFCLLSFGGVACRPVNSHRAVENGTPSASYAVVVYEAPDAQQSVPRLPARYVATPSGWLFLEDATLSDGTPLNTEPGSKTYSLPEDAERFNAEVGGMVTSTGAMWLLASLGDALSSYAKLGQALPLQAPPPVHDWTNLSINQFPAMPFIVAGIISNSQWEVYQMIARREPNLGLWDYWGRGELSIDLDQRPSYWLIDSAQARFTQGKFSGVPQIENQILGVKPLSANGWDGITVEMLRVTWFRSDAYPQGAWSIWLRFGLDLNHVNSLHLILLEPESPGGGFRIPPEIVERASRDEA